MLPNAYFCLKIAPMKSWINLLFFIVLVLFVTNLKAQIEISAEYRPRLEINNGFGNLPTIGTDPSIYVSQRARLNFDFQKERNRLFFSIQDVRFWGDDNIASPTGAFMNSNSLGLFQVWAEFAVGSRHRIKVGRQEFRYDDQRLLSIRNWVQHGITYDALLYGYRAKGWELDMALSYNSDSERGAAGFGNNYFNVDPIARRIRTLNFVYLKKQFSPSFYISATGILSGYQLNKTSNTLYMMTTYGMYGSFKGKLLEMQGNVFRQGGMSQKGKNMDAFLYTFDAGLKLGKLRPGFGIDIVSGNDATNQNPAYVNKEHDFDLLYGIRYARYGFMNQYVMQSSTLGGGWVDVYPQLHLQLTKKNRLTADYHLFFLQQTVNDPTRPGQFLSGSLGSELDLVWHHQFNSEIATMLGFSYYYTNDTFARVKNIEPSQLKQQYFIYYMLTFKPVLFKSSR